MNFKLKLLIVLNGLYHLYVDFISRITISESIYQFKITINKFSLKSIVLILIILLKRGLFIHFIIYKKK